ncbi:hypothetical protein K461DRAFT_129668 [Myriangium duriaei CBS 260.36]|uniref:Uncharacterized protein n=1 Tax=Myriangium duriaei CBS 260.36 TaxID=1168546 RepID=A0A9P4J2W2_9PEZI|nr:hypothetical protein K461DRAFT_129668 [Myriangium duriaei CBS 260.36]
MTDGGSSADSMRPLGPWAIIVGSAKWRWTREVQIRCAGRGGRACATRGRRSRRHRLLGMGIALGCYLGSILRVVGGARERRGAPLGGGGIGALLVGSLGRRSEPGDIATVAAVHRGGGRSLSAGTAIAGHQGMTMGLSVRVSGCQGVSVYVNWEAGRRPVAAERWRQALTLGRIPMRPIMMLGELQLSLRYTVT